VLEFPRIDEKSGCLRMKARAKSDGETGYFSVSSNEGKVFARVLL